MSIIKHPNTEKLHFSADQVNALQEVLENNLSTKTLLNEIIQYLPTDTAGQILLDIANTWDCTDECRNTLW